MASAEDYAAWIVANADKKGTPEFDTVAQAYQQAKSASDQQPEPKPEPLSMGRRIAGGAMRGMVGGPVGIALGVTGAVNDIGNEALNKVAYDAGGKVTDLTGSPALGYATNVATQAAPALLGGKLTGMMASPAMEAGAAGLMRSALKPGVGELKNGKAASEIQTLLDEGINVTPGGVMKLKNKISALNDEITSAISSSPARIDKNATYGPVKDALDKFSKQVNPQSDLEAIKSAWSNFINHPVFQGTNLSVQDAQQLKQGTYKVLSGKYGEIGSASTEAEKGIARGLKDEIAKAVPGIADLNAEESKLLAALGPTERRVFVDANKNPMGIALLSHSPKAWAAFMADRSPLFKSLMARALYSGSERIPQLAGSTGITAAGLFGQPQSALLNPEQQR